jgi:ATP-dependent RNA helicase RhlE
VLTLTPKTTVYTGCDILVGTGRIMDLTLDNVALRKCKKLVIDEFDEMLNLGFRTQLTAILAMMPKTSKYSILSNNDG